MVCRLFAGANGIRTIGPLMTKPPDSDVRGGPQAWIVLSRKNRHLVCGTCGSNLVSSRGESVSAVHREAAREKSRASRDSERRWGRETGWADRKPALSGVFSLTGIDAVPPWGSADYVQRRASRGDNRGWGISSFVDHVVRSLCCSAQSSGRSSSVRLVAVSSTGCRPCKIASTSCGLKKARPTRRRM